MSLKAEATAQGLSEEEFDRIVRLIGRDPNRVELGIFAALWSEHCCYKSTRIYLKNLPTKGAAVLQGPGENAGVLDLGFGLALAFKIESHNHPSFIEPYQGAATGVGGILRDIFTMGARPIALLDSLCFGDPTLERTGYLLHGVVGGIGGYGNCMGIPTVGGEIHFDSSYNGNNLVNAMCVGVAKKEKLHRAAARGNGNKVIYLGSKTGRDGIHGATMASEEFGSGNEERRPTVQVGDPFTEKLLLEGCLEMMNENLLVGIQDMGAAGIACSTFEMSSRGNVGMEINLDAVPLRETGMNAWEIFLSESQERMLLVAEPAKVARIQEIAKKWEIDCAEIGTVTGSKKVIARYHGENVVDLPVKFLTDEAPEYTRPFTRPKPFSRKIELSKLPSLDLIETLEKLISSPNLCSREKVYRQYDNTVGADTIGLPGGDASVMRIKGTPLAVAMTVDANSNFVAADPFWGTQHLVAEAVRNLAVCGARPIGVTNCLNFGNPEDPEVMGQIKYSIDGLAESCRFFGVPITGGNVSLYNQTGSINIRPTPTIGMVGVIDDARQRLANHFPAAGMTVALAGPANNDPIFQSEFARTILREPELALAPLDLKAELNLMEFLIAGAKKGFLRSAHDCSEGGIGIALIESCLAPNKDPIGLSITLPSNDSPVPFLFNESPSRAIISYRQENQKEVETVARDIGVSLTPLGITGGKDFEVSGIVRIPLRALAKARDSFFNTL